MTAGPTPEPSAQTGEQPAEALKTEQPQEQTVPYSRFKEVNDKLTALEKKEREREAAATKEAERKAQEQGEFEKLAKERADRIAQLEADIAKREHEALRARVAAKHKLPEALADRLRGENEAELEADAKELAKLKVISDAPKTETGKSSQGDGKQPEQSRQEQKQPYRFQDARDVAW